MARAIFAAVASLFCSSGVRAQCAYPGCPPGTPCNSTTQTLCSSLRCVTSTCLAPSCQDNLRNGFEPYLDCGGPCRACPDASQCFVGSDCRSGVCANLGGATSPYCRPASCYDRAFNGPETDIDCGSFCCPLDQPLSVCAHLCQDGFQCNSDYDCESFICRRNEAVSLRFCAGSRVTDDQPHLSSRIISAVRLVGQKKRSFRPRPLLIALAWAAGVDVGQIRIEAITDVRMPVQMGLGAYADVLGNNSGVALEPGTGAVVYPAAGESSLARLRRLVHRDFTASSERGTLVLRNLQGYLQPSYFVSTSDTVSAIDVRFSTYVRPSEVLLIADRIAGALNGSGRVLPGGWDWEDRLALAHEKAAAQRDFCAAQGYVCWNATTHAFFADFGVPCAEYFPNATCVWPSETPTPSRTPISGSGRAARRLPVSPMVRSGVVWDPYIAGNWSANYSWAVSLATLPRVSFSDVLGSLDAAVVGLDALEPTYVDPYASQPSSFVAPVGLKVVIQPSGTRTQPLWPGVPFAVQPQVALVDAHGRIGVESDQALRISATLVEAELEPEQRLRVALTGTAIVRSNGTHGIVSFSDLGLTAAPNGTVRSVRLAFNVSYRVDVAGSTPVIQELTGLSDPFVVLPAPVIPPVIYVRKPLSPWIVATIFLLCLSLTVGGGCCALRVWRKAHTPARVHDVTLATASARLKATAAGASGNDTVDAVSYLAAVSECEDSEGSSQKIGCSERPPAGAVPVGGPPGGRGFGRSRRRSSLCAGPAVGGPPGAPGGGGPSAATTARPPPAWALPVVHEASLPGLGPSFAAALQNTLTSLAHVDAPTAGQRVQAGAPAPLVQPPHSRHGLFGWGSSRLAQPAQALPALDPEVQQTLERYRRPNDPDADEWNRRQAEADQRRYVREAVRNGAGYAAFTYAAGTVGRAVANAGRSAGRSLVGAVRAGLDQLTDEYAAASSTGSGTRPSSAQIQAEADVSVPIAADAEVHEPVSPIVTGATTTDLPRPSTAAAAELGELER